MKTFKCNFSLHKFFFIERNMQDKDFLTFKCNVNLHFNFFPFSELQYVQLWRLSDPGLIGPFCERYCELPYEIEPHIEEHGYSLRCSAQYSDHSVCQVYLEISRSKP